MLSRNKVDPLIKTVFVSATGHCNGNRKMLLALFQWIAEDIRAFNVFSYITLRTMLAALTALSISF